MILRVCLLSLALLLAGCSRWDYRLGTALDGVALERAGELTTLAEALALLGPPHRAAALADAYVLGWEHWRIRERTLGVSLGAFGADLLAVDWGHARVAGEFLLLRVDRSHAVTAVAFDSWDERGGGGSALQPSIALVDVVDVADLVEPLPQHAWGRLMLVPLPVSLNRGSSPDSGDAALEQRATPAAAGQRSLSMP